MPQWPMMRTCELTSPHPALDDPAATARQALGEADLPSLIPEGAEVAVAVGSRGIAAIASVAREVVAAVREAGGRPFLVPAMGSHGGATPHGQVELLAYLGLTEASMGCPVRSSMETHILAELPGGFPVHFDRHALAADRVVVVNRIKMHPRFVGAYESGLMKMLIVGLGKTAGAIAVHRLCPRRPFDDLVREAGAIILERAPVAFGVGIIENALHQPARIEVVPARRLLEVEPSLLEQAKRLMPRLPAREVDLLVVERIGKDVSGTGMDPYVIGLRPDSPTRVGRIVVLDLTPATAGNAHGIGFADFTTQRVWDKADMAAMRMNAMTAGRPEGARLPIPLSTDREAVLAGLDLAGGPEARVARIVDTANLRRFEASEALWGEISAQADARLLDDAHEMGFDAGGGLLPMAAPG